ncbi:MAG: hypothetical protein DMF63_11085 [Acidobacteria bacterium]|nr:MAG: hypothetical protein DMF63_11085 [Acidobacteriota bacterium]
MSLENLPSFFLNLFEGDVNGEATHSYEFKSFRLDLEERQLLRNGTALPLTPKAFDVLATLVVRSGHLVEKDDLLRSVWGESFVEEANVARIVHTLRRILGEDENGNKFIETVPTKGYRFVADVTQVFDEPSTSAVVAQSPPTSLDTVRPPSVPVDDEPAIYSKRNPRIVLFVAGFATAISLIVVLSFDFQWGSAGNNAAVKTIAVLPLRALNGDDRDPLYDLGIADSLINRLSSTKGLLVRPLSSTRQYEESEIDPVAAGKEQKVDYVLASNYQIQEGKIRITSQLINVGSGKTEETYKTEKEISKAFELQDAFAVEIGNRLMSRFALHLSGDPSRRGTTNEEAYRLYLQGMSLYDRRSNENAKLSVRLLDQAVQLEPTYALAWAGDAHAHRYLGNMVRNTSSSLDEEYKKSIEAVNRALALDPNLSEAHSALCENKYMYEFDSPGAESECKRALELDPNSALAHDIYSRFLSWAGRHAEAIAESDIAIELEPTSHFFKRNLGMHLFYARRYDDAVLQLRRVIEVDKEFGNAYQWLSRIFVVQGKETEAFEAWMDFFSRSSGKNPEATQAYNTAFQTSGYRGFLLERMKRFDESSQGLFQGAAYAAELGDNDRAFDYLEKSLERREGWMMSMNVDPRLDTLRDDPRYIRLLERVAPR